MKNRFIQITTIAFYILLSGCAKDNYDTPKSSLSGSVSNKGQVLNVRSNGVQLELWQRGFQLFSKIPVYISQDGTFSVALFDGDYKLVRLKGNGPWADNTDSIDVHVAGATTVDVPVDPYFVLQNVAFTRTGTTITATFTVGKVNATKALELVRIDIGQTYITDVNTSAGNVQKLAATITDLSQPITMSITVPAALATKDYVYARVGVKTAGVSELVYSTSQQISLK